MDMYCINISRDSVCMRGLLTNIFHTVTQSNGWSWRLAKSSVCLQGYIFIYL